ncbi:hypothetical protein [Sphingobium yanoikuyae]|uniref:hypothetical protein n=1 Tax=Sphingobium yanoikuyae TaxID=13690 RepID=UPI0028A866F9|nr:hypothetical protein [Sphingobium yanoikuyae]
MSDRPTLHEIADMPFPASEQALLQHYGVEPWREKKAGEIKSFDVTISYSWREYSSATYSVEAVDEEEAEALAGKLFDAEKEIPYDVDVDNVDISEVRQ